MKCKKCGGVRTYAKRYLYMEALNISDNNLDLDSDAMKDKSKLKPQSKDTKLENAIKEIQFKVEALRKLKISDTDIASAIKRVYSDGGAPTANYKTCQDVETANKILEELNRSF